MASLQLCLFDFNKSIEKTISVNRSPFTIGRSLDSDWPLDFPGISRIHARLFQDPEGQWYIEDPGSKNGTFLNGTLIKNSYPLRSKDILEIGPITIKVFLRDSSKKEQDTINPVTGGLTIFRDVNDLRKHWVNLDEEVTEINSKLTIIDRLKDLVEIAKRLNSAESSEAIFSQVKTVVFRYLSSIERLALLVDIKNIGRLQLLNAAARFPEKYKDLATDESWVSRSICQKVFAEKVAIQTSDAQMDNRFDDEQSIFVKGIHSVMAVPLWNENKVVGVLYADGMIPFSNSTAANEDNLSFFSTLANLVAASVQRWLLTRQLRKAETIRLRLERYHSPAVVQQMMMAGDLTDGRILPKESEISILFADIVGFTALSERLTPAQIAELLNSFFEEMLKDVFAFGGTLDKFIGDCIMTFFGAPEPQPDHAQRAVDAAKGMLEHLERLNANKVLREPLQLRIAINSGKAVVGDVGSSKRVDYTVLGATINLASRMEAICQPGNCVISETTYSLLRASQRFEFDDIGEYRFKGIDRPIKIYQTQKRFRL